MLNAQHKNLVSEVLVVPNTAQISLISNVNSAARSPSGSAGATPTSVNLVTSVNAQVTMSPAKSRVSYLAALVRSFAHSR